MWTLLLLAVCSWSGGVMQGSVYPVESNQGSAGPRLQVSSFELSRGTVSFAVDPSSGILSIEKSADADFSLVLSGPRAPARSPSPALSPSGHHKLGVILPANAATEKDGTVHLYITNTDLTLGATLDHVQQTGVLFERDKHSTGPFRKIEGSGGMLNAVGYQKVLWWAMELQKGITRDKCLQQVDIDHIYDGEWTKNNKVAGCHSVSSALLQKEDKAKFEMTSDRGSMDKNGVYSISLDYWVNEKQKVEVKGMSTVFPDHWSKDRVLFEVCWAWLVERGDFNKVMKVDETTWSGQVATVDGLWVRGFLQANNKVSAYPLYQKKL